MWRALVFIGLLALAAFGAVWLADRPGSVVITWGGLQAQTSVAFAAVAILVLAMVLTLIWSIVRFLLNLPNRMNRRSGHRRRERGFAAVSRGMVAVGSGDPVAARRHAGEAERLLGRQPLTLLLKAQAAQISGDKPGAEAAFQTMAETDETRVLGLRGLFVEARRRGDEGTARAYATEAARLAPAVSWANEAVLEAQCAEGDWRGALASVERRASLGLLDKATARRHRAVLLTAHALAGEDGDPDRALAEALEATRLEPDLVPAAALAGRLLSRRADLRRASKVVEQAWKRMPHPDLAETYLALRLGDSTLDRVRRAETLARLSSWDPEARLALARAAMDAREFARARDVLRPVLDEHPTVRAYMLMAEIEAAEHGRDSGRVREWLTRAARAPRDPAWIADGVVSETWAPVSPVTGRLDAFVWQSPPDLIAGRDTPFDLLAASDEEPAPPPAIAAPEPRGEGGDTTIEPFPAAEIPTPAATEPPAADVAPEKGSAPVPIAEEVPRSLEPRPATGPLSTSGKPPLAGPATPEFKEAGPSSPTGTPRENAAKPPQDRADATASKAGEPRPEEKTSKVEPVVFPGPRAPDDPGPQAETTPPRRRLFG
jgi:HemY protein